MDRGSDLVAMALVLALSLSLSAGGIVGGAPVVALALAGAYVATHLRKLNQVAYVRFMSVYRSFDDVEAFIDEIRDVKERAAVESPDQQSLFKD
jgi:transcriptional repressor NrdR